MTWAFNANQAINQDGHDQSLLWNDFDLCIGCVAKS